MAGKVVKSTAGLISRDEVDRIAAETSPIRRALFAEQIDESELARRVRAELDAEDTKIVQFDGLPESQDLHDMGVKVISKDKGKGKTVLAVKTRDWTTQQRARMDAQKLMGLYPADEVRITFEDGLAVILAMLPADLRATVQGELIATARAKIAEKAKDKE